MTKKVITLLFLLSAISYQLSACFAQPISSSELIRNAKSYDGKMVVYAGEVIGDVMPRGRYAWININDGNNAIGIWVSRAVAKSIFYTGSYRAKGDVVEVSGIFHRACPEHGGDLDIHAQLLRKVTSGRVLAERINIDKKNLAIILAGILCIILILRQFKPKSKK
ncbi:MAG: DNA-binding protein [Candidatus Omnitrophica bacterium]|jgi:hypothetical protein|nr:DNA-binding protein [Candidatus Omnitrophota bacterium]